MPLYADLAHVQKQMIFFCGNYKNLVNAKTTNKKLRFTSQFNKFVLNN